MKRKHKLILLALYSLAMLWLLFGQRIGQSNDAVLQLRPLGTLRLFFWVLCNSNDPAALRHAVVNLVGNVVMFIPLGCLLPWIWEFWGKFWRHILLMASMIAIVEVVQILTLLGTCDIDDLLLNLVGTSMGFLLWKVCFAKRQKISKS